MSMEVLVPVAGILAVFAAMLVVLKIMRSKGLSFTARVFTALGLGVLLGLGIQLLLGRDGDAATTALDWISIVGQGYIGLLKMLVMPLVFVAIVGAFTRAEVTEHFGRIAFAVLAVLLGTVTVAAVLGWGATVLTGLAHAGFLDAATPDAAELSSLASQQSEAASLTLPQEILSFIPTNPFADLAGARSTSTIAVVIFSAILGVAYIRLRDKDVDQADFFKSLIDSLYGIVMRIVAMVLGLTPYGILALIAKVMAASDYRAILGLGKFVLVSYGALLAVLCVHCLILLANRVNPATYFKKAFPVLSFAFVSRSSAGALPLNIETQHKALGVDSASANLAASFGMSIGYRAERVRGRVPGDAGHHRGAYRRHRRAVSYVLRAAHRRGGHQLVRCGRSGRGSDVRLAHRVGDDGASYRGGGRPRIRGAAHRHGSHRPQRQRLHGGGHYSLACCGRPRPLGSGRSGGACHRRGARELTGMKKALEG